MGPLGAGSGRLESRALARFDTPAPLADFLAERVLDGQSLGPPATDPHAVCDPTCGGGALLLAARRRGARVYGVDIDPAAAAESARALGERIGGRIKVGDALLDPLAGPALADLLAAHRLLLEDAAERRLHALDRDDARLLAAADARLVDLKAEVTNGLPDSLASRAFCWPLEFPEIALAGGFDAILTNPPWDKLKVHARETLAEGQELERLRSRAAELSRWLATRWGAGAGDRNRYQAVVALAMALLHPGGGLGAVLPGGFWTDLGACPLREALVTRFASLATWGLEARTDAFPDIDQRVALVLALRSRPPLADTSSVPLTETSPVTFSDSSHVAIAGGIRRIAELSAAVPFTIPASLIRRTAPISLAFPALRGHQDVAILERIYHAGPAFGDGPWQPVFGRDLDMTLDAPAFTDSSEGAPLWEGKRIGAFELCPVDPASSGAWPACGRACSRWRRCPARRDGGRQFRVDDRQRPDRGDAAFSRLAWRSVARGDRARRLEAALIPPGYRLGNSLNYIKGDRHREAEKLTLLAYLNSLILEWRLRQLACGNNVNLFAIRQLPVPPGARPELFEPAAALMYGSAGWDPRGTWGSSRTRPACGQAPMPPPDRGGEVHALTDAVRAAVEPGERHRLRILLEVRVARIFGLSLPDLEHLLGSFPKLAAWDRSEILTAFSSDR